jgi:tRNA-Thr(GGU) m(6)t(6)A37 methyltransferase TsaA
MTGQFAIRPIGVVRSTRKEPEDDQWDSVTSFIDLDATQLGPEAVAGLDGFSHIEVFYVFDRVDPRSVQIGARHPRNNTAWPKVGIFAQRAKNRPNRLGATVCRLDRVDQLTLHVTGLDAIEGTPVIDVKPWVREFAPRGEVRQPDWMTELMRRYWV